MTLLLPAFATQMLLPSKQIAEGEMLTGDAPSNAPLLALSFVMLLLP
jgi:hypothetical protein